MTQRNRSSPAPGAPRRLALATLAVAAVLAAGCRAKPMPVAPANEDTPQEGAFALAFSGDGKTLATWDWDNSLRLWDAAGGKPQTVVERQNRALALCLSADGKLAATGHLDGTVRLWDVPGKQELGALKGHRQAVPQLAFSPDGKTLASGSGLITGVGSELTVWDVAAKALRKTKVIADGIGSLAFSPDGKTLAMGVVGEVQLWDPEKVEVLGALPSVPDEAVSSLAYSGDGKTLAGGTGEGKVRLWDAAARKPLATLEGHSDEVDAVRFAPDGRLLATGARDKSARLWDVEAQKEKHVLAGHAGPVKAVAFADGGKLLTAATDRAIRSWDTATGREARE